MQRIQDLGPLLGLVLLCIAGWALNPDFATADNVLNVLTRTAFIGIIAVGMTFVIISGGIDLSVGSMAALIAPTRWSNGSAISSLAESPSRSSASAAGPVPAAAWLRRRVRSLVACSMPDIDTPASSPARSSVWIEATVVPSDCASLACASRRLS